MDTTTAEKLLAHLNEIGGGRFGHDIGPASSGHSVIYFAGVEMACAISQQIKDCIDDYPSDDELRSMVDGLHGLTSLLAGSRPTA